MPRALIITAAGINCDRELAHAFQLAGAEPESILLSRLMRQPTLVDGFDLVGLPGGFSYGDDVAAGRIMGQLIRRNLYTALVAALQRGCPMIAPCNGFQIAVQSGLLPGPVDGADWPESPATPEVALCQNLTARFNDTWTRIEIPSETRCIWTSDLQMAPGTDLLPCAHGEGRFVASDASISRLQASGQVALRYVSADNFNGSVGDIAGICDPTGLLLGLMPHPERYTRWTQHPVWTRLDQQQQQQEPPGLRMFRRAVSHVGAGVC